MATTILDLLAQSQNPQQSMIGQNMSTPGGYVPLPVVDTGVSVTRPAFSDAGFDAANGITPAWTGSNSASLTGDDFLTSLKNFFSGAVGSKEAPGWGGLAIGAGQSLLGGYLGMKQYGLAKQSLAQSKQQFETNFAAQRNLTNSQLADRQKSRIAAGTGIAESEAEYMAKYGVK